jgi:hypothetical protein
MSHVSITPNFDEALKVGATDKIGAIPKMALVWLTKSTVLYGISGSGKSTLIREIMYMLSKVVPMAVLFCPTADMNDTYTNVIPRIAMHTKPTHTKVRQIFEKQELKAILHKDVNTIDNLLQIFKMLSSMSPPAQAHYHKTRTLVKRMHEQLKVKIQQIKRSQLVDAGERKNRIAQITAMLNDKSIELYKMAIHKFKAEFGSYHNMEHQEKYQAIINNLYMNPHLVMIFDDCITDIKALCKKGKNRQTGADEPPIFEEVFTRGRHCFITVIVAIQDDNNVPPLMRKNAFMTVFTESQSAEHFLRNGANSISRKVRDYGLEASQAIFGNSTTRNFRKMIFDNRNAQYPFMYTVAEIYEEFRFGSRVFWEYCRSLQVEESEDDRRVFYSNFLN